MRFVLVGAGFWSHYQLSAWQEVRDVVCVAVVDRDATRAQALAQAHGIPRVYTDVDTALDAERPDFVDIVTDPPSHAALVQRLAPRGLGIVCQKPLALAFDDARAMVEACERHGARLFVHENWRFQAAIQALKALLDADTIGPVFRARIDFVSGFSVFDNQPYLRTIERFILTDLGVHLLDTARFLFGEARALFAHTQRAHADIAGEDVATVVLTLRSGATVVVNLAYAGTPLEDECFPQTLFFLEGETGSIALRPGGELRVTTAAGTTVWTVSPPTYAWANPTYAVAQTSAVACCADLLAGLRGEPGGGQTHGRDNLETLRLVFGAYDSAASGQAVLLP
jgi:predicted dehydrogenase